MCMHVGTCVCGRSISFHHPHWPVGLLTFCNIIVDCVNWREIIPQCDTDRAQLCVCVNSFYYLNFNRLLGIEVISCEMCHCCCFFCMYSMFMFPFAASGCTVVTEFIQCWGSGLTNCKLLLHFFMQSVDALTSVFMQNDMCWLTIIAS